MKGINNMKEPVLEFFGYDQETIAAIDDGDIKVEWAYIGEGHNWEYDPDDPEDEELLRFYVSRYDEEYGWEPVEDASYCTNMPLNTDQRIIEDSLRALYDRFRDAMDDPYASVKKLGEELSWISPDEF